MSPQDHPDDPHRAEASDDPGQRAIVGPLLDKVRPASVLLCALDSDLDSDHGLPRILGSVVSTTTADELGAALAAQGGHDVVWFRGRANWHTISGLAGDIATHWSTRSTNPPIVIAEGPPSDPVPAWMRNDTYAAQLARAESSKEGVRQAVSELRARVDPDATLLWCPSGRGTAALVPSPVADGLGSWLTERLDILETLAATHRENVRLIGRNFALLELLEDAQRSANAVVASRRFRIGTRLTRLARKLTRRDREIFRAPRQILARQKIVDDLRSQLESERHVDEVPLAPDALRVTYVLPELRLSGGALVVVELVNELRMLGVDARIATLRVDDGIYKTRLLTQPLAFQDVSSMVQGLPESDVVVATHWSTAAWVCKIIDAGRAARAAYFVQDYEAWFYPETDIGTRADVERTYELISRKITTSRWLQELLQAQGHESQRIPPGLDLGRFYPRAGPRQAHPVILAMARPRTPRRGFETLVATLTTVHEEVPSAEIVLFGEKLGGMSLPFPHRDEGVVSDQEQLARLYSSADVHVDCSDFQAFGRPALEAMACGTASVLTEVGGATEYARDGENSILVPPKDPTATADAVVALLRNDERRRELGEAGLDTVADFSMTHRARQTLAFLEETASVGT